MIISVLFRKGKAVLPVKIHENSLADNSSVSVIERLLDWLSSSDFQNFFSLSEILPLVFEQVLKLSRLVSYRLVVYIFVVDVGSC